jgi:2-iminobutanoate/2-iminopropanoate deaminase
MRNERNRVSNDRRVIVPEWSAGGHYSQAIAAGATLFVAGQTAGAADDPAVAAMDVAAQTRVAIDRLEALVSEAGGSLADVVKTTCFLADIADFAAFNAVYAERFPAPPPVRSTFGVALAGALRVEIEAMAVIDA